MCVCFCSINFQSRRFHGSGAQLVEVVHAKKMDHVVPSSGPTRGRPAPAGAKVPKRNAASSDETPQFTSDGGSVGPWTLVLQSLGGTKTIQKPSKTWTLLTAQTRTPGPSSARARPRIGSGGSGPSGTLSGCERTSNGASTPGASDSATIFHPDLRLLIPPTGRRNTAGLDSTRPANSRCHACRTIRIRATPESSACRTSRLSSPEA